MFASLSIRLAWVTTKPGKWAKLFHSKLQYCSQLVKQTTHSIFSQNVSFFPKQIYVLKKSLEITYESKFSIFSFLFLTNKKVLINLGRVLISYQKRDLLLLVSLYFSKLFLKKLKTWLIDLIKGPTFYKWANIIYCGKVVYSTWSLSYMYISFTTYLH